MLNDALKIVLDPVMPPKVVPMPMAKNNFELIFQDASARHGNAVNIRRSFSRELMYPKDHVMEEPVVII